MTDHFHSLSVCDVKIYKHSVSGFSEDVIYHTKETKHPPALV